MIKWFVTPDDTDGAQLTFGEVVLLPGKGHERHNHPESEEVLYVLAGEGEQMLDDGGENSFAIRTGDTIYVPTGMFHSTVNTGWQPLRLLALYNPGGAEKALRELPDFREGEGPRLGSAGVKAGGPTVLLIGTLDTKGDEYAFLRDRLRDAGVEVLLADVGTLEPPRCRAGHRREEVAAGTGADLAALRRGPRPRRCRDRHGRCRRGARAPAARRGPHPRRAGRRRLGQHRDRHARDAGAARRRAQADGLHDGRRGHARLRGRARRDDDGLGGRRGGREPVSARVLANAAAAMAGMVQRAGRSS